VKKIARLCVMTGLAPLFRATVCAEIEVLRLGKRPPLETAPRHSYPTTRRSRRLRNIGEYIKG
jgi:hypothetical protein